MLSLVDNVENYEKHPALDSNRKPSGYEFGLFRHMCERVETIVRLQCDETEREQKEQ
jgi:hypothetical protein